jgi:hypothetical protein
VKGQTNVGICKSRPWAFPADTDIEIRPSPADARTDGADGERPREDPAQERRPEAARAHARIAAERAERRRMALVAADANRLRNEMGDQIQAVLAALPVSGLQEFPRRGRDIFLATARIDWLSQPADLRIRAFASEGSVRLQVDVPRLRTRLTLPIDSAQQRAEIPKALVAIVLRSLD